MGQAKLKKLAIATEANNPVYEIAKANQSYYFTKAMEARFKPGVITTKVDFPDTGPVACNLNVLAYCKALGGTPVFGWIIDDNEPDHKEHFESSAREHFVVLTSDGRYVDPTPYPFNGNTSVFIPTGEEYTFDEIESFKFRSNIMFYEHSAKAQGQVAATGKLLWLPTRHEDCMPQLFRKLPAANANAILLDEDYYFRYTARQEMKAGLVEVETSEYEDLMTTIAKLKAKNPNIQVMFC